MAMAAIVGWLWTLLTASIILLAWLGAVLHDAGTGWIWFAALALAPGLLLIRCGRC